MKREAKQRVVQEKKVFKETGGGSEDEDKGYTIDYMIKDLLPHEFKIDESHYDSQAVEGNANIKERATNKLEKYLNNQEEDCFIEEYILDPETGCVA